jgi:hypothetical protein
MKKLLLILVIGLLFSCEQIEEATPKKEVYSNEATITIKSKVKTGIVLAYMYKSEWKFEEPWIIQTTARQDTTIKVIIKKDQNFTYFVHRIDSANAYVTVNLKFREHDQTKTFYGTSGQLWDIYEFYRQEW